MKISLKSRDNSNGTTSLYLLYYSGYLKDNKGKMKLKRKTKFLDISLITNPRNSNERTFNKSVWETANNILKAEQIESLKSGYEFNPESRQNINFIDYFTDEIEKRNLKSTTLYNYNSTLKHLIAFCNPDTTTFKDVDEDFISRFKQYLNDVEIHSNRKLKNNTKVMYFTVLKSIVKQAYKVGIITQNPFDVIKGFKTEETGKNYLDYEEIQKLINTECKNPIIKQAFLFSCFTGLRFSDIQALKWEQIVKEKAGYKLIYKQIKTRGQEYLNLNEQIVNILAKRGNPDEQVFKGLKYNMTINNNILRWVNTAGINKSITFHSARHTFATMLLNNGVDIYTVSKLLGHKNIKTTEIYAKIINLKMIESINKFPKFNFN